VDVPKIGCQNSPEIQDCTAALQADSQQTEKQILSQTNLPPSSSATLESAPTDALRIDVSKAESSKFPHNVWVNIGGISHHFDRSKNFNENNFGIGIEYELNEDVAFAVGRYKNSIRNTSHYAAIAYTPLHLGNFSLGVAAGTVDGYYFNNGGFIPMAMPMASYETKHFGVNAMFVPKMKDISSVVALQFKERF
jgi:hypothetical protein